MGTTTTAVTDQSFEAEVIKSDKLVLVDFWAEWCGPCRALAPKLEEIGNEMSAQVKIAKINVDENQNYAQKFHVRSIPTMILFKGGQAVEQIVGNLPKESILGSIKKHL